MRTRRWWRESSSIQGRHTGLSGSYSRWVSQCGARTRGGPSPVSANASRVPSKLAQNRICCFICCSRGSFPVQRPVELLVTQAHVAQAPVDHLDRSLVGETRGDELEDAALAAEIVGEPAEELRQDEDRASILHTHRAPHMIGGG